MFRLEFVEIALKIFTAKDKNGPKHNGIAFFLTRALEERQEMSKFLLISIIKCSHFGIFSVLNLPYLVSHSVTSSNLTPRQFRITGLFSALNLHNAHLSLS